MLVHHALSQKYCSSITLSILGAPSLATELLMALFSEISANQTPRIHISDGAPLLNDDQDTFDSAEFLM